MFQKIFYMFKPHKKNMWTSGFFIKKKFPLLNVHQIVSIFWCFDIFHKKESMCSKHSKNANTYTFSYFNTWMSVYTIIVLNL
jgi:hypothetical protein